MLVDDTPAILAMTRKMLERLGYRVYPAETPKEARRIAASCDRPIDIHITDVVMSEMNLPFISGYTHNAIAHQGVLDEGVSYFQKPFSMKELSEKIKIMLE